jgi:K(+)-stimulated pyrophosphate-energized sodium pump
MKKLFILFSVLTLPLLTFASEADIILPNLRNISFFNGYLSGWELLFWGSLIVFLGLFYGMSQFIKIRRYPVHKSMKKVADTIYATCKTYLLQQGRFLFLLFIIVGVIIAFYFGVLNAKSLGAVSLILLWTVLGILGSYIVAWFGIRINTLANCRTSFASLQGKPCPYL